MFSANKMKKSKKDLIDTIRLITSLIALTMTLMSVVKKFIDWSDKNTTRVH